MIKTRKIKDKKAISHFDFLFGNKNLLKSKRSQIGSTLTWFVGFLVIFFVMILFLGATIVLARLREVSKSDPEKYNIYAVVSQRVLMHMLDEQINYDGAEMTFKELIEKWASGDKKAKDELKNKIQGNLNSLLGKNEGYLFYVAYLEIGKEIKEGIYGGGFIQIDGAEDSITLSNNFELHGVATEAKAALGNATTLYLISDKNIKLKLYIGEANANNEK